MEILTLDIETIPRQDLPEALQPQFDPSEVKLGNLKDPDKVSFKLAEAEVEFNQGLAKKMSVDPDLCQVTTFVGYVYETARTETKVSKKVELQWPPEDEEYEVVFEAWDCIKQAYNRKIPLVTFNGTGFDLRVLFTAAMRLDIPVSRVMYDRLIAKWDNPYHYDLMRILTGENHPVRGKNLDFYLHLYGVGGKMEGMDGSKVYEAWQAKEYAKILEYCGVDVLRTAQLFDRVQYWMPIENIEQVDMSPDEGKDLFGDALWAEKTE